MGINCVDTRKKPKISCNTSDNQITKNCVSQHSISYDNLNFNNHNKNNYYHNMGKNNNSNNIYNKTITKDEINNNNENHNIKNNNFNEINIYDKALEIHNNLRLKHNCQQLKLNKKLCEKAQNYAERCAQSNNAIYCIDLYQDEVLGQNIYIEEKNQLNINKICNDWYKEKNNYDFTSNKYKEETCHFTQLVWKSTKFVGFGYASGNGKIYFVAYYYPAGNIFNEFNENVQ